ncbi:MAG: hypothetical protein FWD43_04920, partial [Coriobacteriia bacterium]|nr:hypothetical protein [Coriobacteriia bacterium]
FTNLGADFYDLSFRKTVAGGSVSAADRDQLFPFTVFFIDPEGLADPEPAPLSADGIFGTWCVDIVGANGLSLGLVVVASRIETTRIGTFEGPFILKLKHDETATIRNLFTGDFEVCEDLTGFAGRYVPSFAYTIGDASGGDVPGGSVTGSGTGASVRIMLEDHTSVTFTNTVGDDTPQTGDNLLCHLLVSLALAFSLGLLGAGVFLHRHLKHL